MDCTNTPPGHSDIKSKTQLEEVAARLNGVIRQMDENLLFIERSLRDIGVFTELEKECEKKPQEGKPEAINRLRSINERINTLEGLSNRICNIKESVITL